MNLSIIGDICLARLINAKFKRTKYRVVSEELVKRLQESDFVIANLESPICDLAETDGDHLSFKGSPEMLSQFSFINCFSLSNNHINDCGSAGMDETIKSLDYNKILHNGLFKEKYKPLIINYKGEKIAIITCTDMMNIPFSKDSNWETLHIDDPLLDQIIEKYKNNNYFIILYAHVGMLFTRFVNPPVRELLHKKIDLGVEIIVTAHSHCLGGMEYYKEKPIFHSLGDFVMDGGSYRRRGAAVLNIVIENNTFKSYNIIPTIINQNLETELASKKKNLQLNRSWRYVSSKLQKHSSNYSIFFNRQYRIEMLQHSLSTIKFLFDTLGIIGMIGLILKRSEEVARMGHWITSNRSIDRRDDEAILKNRKRFSEKDLFDIENS